MVENYTFKAKLLILAIYRKMPTIFTNYCVDLNFASPYSSYTIML